LGNEAPNEEMNANEAVAKTGCKGDVATEVRELEKNKVLNSLDYKLSPITLAREAMGRTDAVKKKIPQHVVPRGWICKSATILEFPSEKKGFERAQQMKRGKWDKSSGT